MPGVRRNSKRSVEIFVLDPAVRTPEVEAFNNISTMSPLPASYHIPALGGMETVLRRQELVSIAGVIILGSAASVNDSSAAWQEPLRDWVQEQLDANIPVLGICFGHQLLAHMAGGCVGPVGATKLRGFRKIQCEGEKRWEDAPAAAGEIAISHEEHVTQVPPDYTVFASSPEVPVDGLRHVTKPVWSFQPHVEATELFCKRRGIPVPAGESQRFDFGHRLLQNFLNYCATAVAGKKSPPRTDR